MFQFPDSNISSTESDVSMRLGKAWTAIYTLKATWKFDLPDKIKQEFFQVIAGSVPLNGCATWTLTKLLEKKVDENYRDSTYFE